MKWILFAIIGLLPLCGCGKKSSTNPAPNLTNAVVPPANAQTPLVGTVDPQLTAVLRSFVQETQRLPQSMLELKNAKLDSMPRPPAGFMFAIDPVTVEVKLVKQ